MHTLQIVKMQILIYERQHYIPMSELQHAMSMSDVVFQRKLDSYNFQCKGLEIIQYNNGPCISCKTAVFFIRWFLDNSYQLHPEINSLKHELSKYTKKIPKRKLSRSMRIEIAYRQQYKCRMCDILLPPDFEVDHIQALEDGGQDIASNLQCLCVPCHTKKTRLNRLRKTKIFSKEAEAEHEAYARPLSDDDDSEPQKPPEKIFSKYFSQYQEN